MLALRPVNTNIIDGTPIGASYSFRFRLLDLLPNDDFTLSKTSKKGPKICQDCMEILIASKIADSSRRLPTSVANCNNPVHRRHHQDEQYWEP